MDYHDFLRTRRSIRRFKTDPVPDSVIQRILTTATYAPSAHNRQPWRFAVVTDLSVKQNLAAALTIKMRADMQAEGADESDIEKRINMSLHRMEEVPVIIVLCRDTTAVRTDAPEEVIMGIQSTALAGLQLLLAAHAEGLGGCWICWPLYAQKETCDSLGLPEIWEPQAMFFVGYADETPKVKEMKDMEIWVKTF